MADPSVYLPYIFRFNFAGHVPETFLRKVMVEWVSKKWNDAARPLDVLKLERPSVFSVPPWCIVFCANQ